ncbi:hypothetical protein GPALN_013007 [Globodera pallida]|nr:hypothetical protein GPALN_013007 [Globodera pallida]
MDTSKENTPPRSQRPQCLHLQPKKATVAEMVELTAQLRQSEQTRDEQIEEEHRLRNEVLELVPRVMKQYLDSRFERLKNAKLEFPRTSNSDRNSEAEELEKAKESLRRLKLKAAAEEEQQKKELEESKRHEMELERRVSRKLEILKALEEM